MTLPRELLAGFSRDAVGALSDYKKEPVWMTDARLRAWEAYQGTPPSDRDLLLKNIYPFTEPPKVPVPSRDWPRELQHALDERGDEEGLIVQRDSTILSRSITKEHSKKGVLFTDMDTAVQAYPELVQLYFGRLAKPDSHVAALRTAFWSGGTFLYVPENLNIQLPFHACHWMSTPESAIFSHTLMIVGDNSRFSFIDECVSAEWPVSGVILEGVEAFIGARARVNCFHLQNCGANVRHYRDERSDVVSTGYLHTSRLDQRPNTSLERAAELYPEVRV